MKRINKILKKHNRNSSSGEDLSSGSDSDVPSAFNVLKNAETQNHRRKNSRKFEMAVLDINDAPGSFSGSTQVTIKYEVDGVGEFEYIGTVDNQGKKDGYGELLYPNGTLYEGEFLDDFRNGLGTLIMSKKTQIIGHWENDMPSENFDYWKIEDGPWSYIGKISLKKNRNPNDLLTNDDFLKSERGELTNNKDGTKYFGTFKENKRSGFGVAVLSNGDQYYGGWSNDQFHEHGTLMSSDGTIFQGMFKAGQKKGKGILYLPNGDVIDGTWSGEHIKDAEYKKGTTMDCSLPVLNQITNRIKEAMRSKDNAGFMLSSEENVTEAPTSKKWHTYFLVNQILQQKEIDFIKTNKSTSVDILLHTLFTQPDHFSFFFLQFFLSCFQGCYNINNYPSHKLRKMINSLVSCAFDDIKSFIVYVSEYLLRFITAHHNHSTSYHDIEKLVSQYVHTTIHQTLFALYQTYYQEQDLLSNQKISSISNFKPSSLGIDPKFILESNDEAPFQKSITIFEKVSQKRNVMDKIMILSEVRESIMNEMKNNRAENRKIKMPETYSEADRQEDESWQPGADDVAPVYTFILLKSKVRNHYALFHYVNDWRGEEVNLMSVSHFITFYEGFLSYVKELDIHLRTDEGEFISAYTICKVMERRIEIQGRLDNTKNTNFDWLPSLLCHISLEAADSGLYADNKTLNVVDAGPQAIARAGSLNRNYSLVLNREKEVLDINNANLLDSIIDKLDVVQNILSHKDIGFSVHKRDDAIMINFNRVYPSHVYLELSVLMSKFLKFELDNCIY